MLNQLFSKSGRLWTTVISPDSISLEELLVKAGVSEDTYLQGLKICTKGNSIVHEESTKQTLGLTPTALRSSAAWKGNIDMSSSFWIRMRA